MPFHQIAKLCYIGDSPLGYRMTIRNLIMIVTLVGEKSDLVEFRFNGLQSYKFVPDDLAHLPEDIELDAFQRAEDKSWLDELRVPSDLHRRYLEDHELYVLHATEVGLLEVVALSAQLNELEAR